MQKFSRFLVRIVEKYLPDPLLFAIILTIIVFIMGLGITKCTPLEMLVFWGNGFWGLLAFAMQMVLVLVTGHTLATSPPFKKLITKIAHSVKNHGHAIILTSFVAALGSWINWGFGLVIGALLAKEIAKNNKGIDYRLLIASAYSGFVVWHAGISGSAPLQVATEGHFLLDLIGIVPTSQTLFAPWNLIASFVIIFGLGFVNKMMIPPEEEIVEIDPSLLVEEKAKVRKMDTPADRLENSPVLSMLTGLAGIAYLIYYFSTKGFALNLNIVNFIFMMFGIILHGTPRNYIDAMDEAIKGAGGIVLQFPFYAGIMGMMADSGLAEVISNWFVSISTPLTFPFYTFLSAGLVNFFVPSGGSQWAVQGPIMLRSALELGVDPARTVMAVAWGDAWTNMIQPFWALPALGIAGLGARDIMGYCIVVLIFSGIVVSLAITFLP